MRIKFFLLKIGVYRNVPFFQQGAVVNNGNGRIHERVKRAGCNPGRRRIARSERDFYAKLLYRYAVLCRIISKLKYLFPVLKHLFKLTGSVTGRGLSTAFFSGGSRFSLAAMRPESEKQNLEELCALLK